MATDLSLSPLYALNFFVFLIQFLYKDQWNNLLGYHFHPKKTWEDKTDDTPLKDFHRSDDDLQEKSQHLPLLKCTKILARHF